jgi:hypothetical protein
MIEGFLRGKGRPPAPASDLDVEAPHPQARSRRTPVWISSCILIVIAAGFGLRYYLAHRSVLLTGELLYKPQVQSEDGFLVAATRVIPVEGAEVIVYVRPMVSFELMSQFFFSRSANRWYPFDPRESSDFANLSVEAQQNAMKEWQSHIANWNGRLLDCYQVTSHAARPEEIVRTYTDAKGQFSLKLRPGVYSLFASSEVPSFLMDDNGRLSAATAYVFWEEQLNVPAETKVVYAAPSCSPD